MSVVSQPLTGQNSVPKDYEEFVQFWQKRMTTAVKQWGFVGGNAEEIVANLIGDFFAGNYLAIYDPEKGGAFTTYVYTFIRMRMYGLNRHRRTQGRKIVEIDAYPDEAPFADPEDIEDICDAVDRQRVAPLQAAMSYLQTLPVRGKRDLPRAFSTFAKQMEQNGYINQSELSREVGISATAVGHQVADLRQALIDSGLVRIDRDGSVHWNT